MVDDPGPLTLDIEGWEGPLDLLLALARTQKVDLRAVSMLALVDQYLAYVDRARAQRLELAADYLVMAAWLAHIKSALLLPRDPEADPDPEALAAALQHRLERLEAMREAGARLMARDRMGRERFPRGAPEGLRTERQARWQADLFELLAAYGEVAARRRPVVHLVAPREVMPIEEAIERLAAMLDGAVDWRELATFLPAGGSDAWRRSARASSFVAALELARQGRVDLRQEDASAPLMLRRSR